MKGEFPLFNSESFCFRRKRIRGTSKYIYEHMFVNGEASDVEVHAAGKVWKLHKVYLKQVSSDRAIKICCFPSSRCCLLSDVTVLTKAM